jgi:hypothetical protein
MIQVQCFPSQVCDYSAVYGTRRDITIFTKVSSFYIGKRELGFSLQVFSSDVLPVSLDNVYD